MQFTLGQPSGARARRVVGEQPVGEDHHDVFVMDEGGTRLGSRRAFWSGEPARSPSTSSR